MLLRKLVVVLVPLLLVMVTVTLFRWLNGWMEAGSFFLFILEGLLLGACIALLLPVAGISGRTNGLARWLFAAAGALVLLVLYQYLETVHVVQWPVIRALFSINGQALLVEGAVLGFVLITGIINRKR